MTSLLKVSGHCAGGRKPQNFWDFSLFFSLQLGGSVPQVRRHKRHWVVPTKKLRENLDYGKDGEYVAKVISSPIHPQLFFWHNMQIILILYINNIFHIRSHIEILHVKSHDHRVKKILIQETASAASDYFYNGDLTNDRNK